MEAMASGLAVVATRSLGVATFAQHAQNCLLADTQVWSRGRGTGAVPSADITRTHHPIKTPCGLAVLHCRLRFECLGADPCHVHTLPIALVSVLNIGPLNPPSVPRDVP